MEVESLGDGVTHGHSCWPLATGADANGFASLSLPIPAGFAWSGQLALQSVWLAPAACGGALLGASNALR